MAALAPANVPDGEKPRYVCGLPQIDGTEDKAIKITFPSATRDFTGQSPLLGNSLPNFYFHCTTAYDILRHCGVEVGKRDFMGTAVSL